MNTILFTLVVYAFSFLLFFFFAKHSPLVHIYKGAVKAVLIMNLNICCFKQKLMYLQKTFRGKVEKLQNITC